MYIHHGEDDAFPTGWGNGQGTDVDGMPFLTLPDGAHVDPGNLFHESFPGAITANPQLALWHSFGNEAPGDPIDWLPQPR